MEPWHMAFSQTHGLQSDTQPSVRHTAFSHTHGLPSDPRPSVRHTAYGSIRANAKPGNRLSDSQLLFCLVIHSALHTGTRAQTHALTQTQHLCSSAVQDLLTLMGQAEGWWEYQGLLGQLELNEREHCAERSLIQPVSCYSRLYPMTKWGRNLHWKVLFWELWNSSHLIRVS